MCINVFNIYNTHKTLTRIYICIYVLYLYNIRPQTSKSLSAQRVKCYESAARVSQRHQFSPASTALNWYYVRESCIKLLHFISL